MEFVERSHNTVVGPDEIHYKFIKQLPQESLQYFLNTFNNICINGEFPKIWKQMSVIPVPKPNKDNTNPQTCMTKELLLLDYGMYD